MLATLSADAPEKGSNPSRVLLWLWGGSLVLALPIALFAAMLPVNEYAAMGIGGIDCDTPAAILGLASVTFLVYGSGALGFGMLATRHSMRRRRFAAVALACALVMAAVTPNALRAMNYPDARACAER